MNILDSKPREMRQCEKHGEYESINYLGAVWSHCPECVEIENEADRLAELEARKAEETAKWERTLKHSSIPERFKDRTLDSYKADNPQQTAALRYCKEYADSFDKAMKLGTSIIFCGNPGTGKTHLAIGIALEAISKHGRLVLFTTVMKSIRRIKATWQRGSEETETQVLEIFTSVDLLILDEVGVQFGSETEENLLFDIINTRYEDRKPTILISNLDGAGVKKYLGERAFDRIREDGGKLIPFTWSSYRGK